MDVKLKQKWIDALRSGNYKQCQASLRNNKDGSYCCLGVLAEVAGLKIADSGKEIECKGYLPIEEILGGDKLFDVSGTNFRVPAAEKLWTLNDSQKAPFSVIADWVEENL